MDYFLTDREKIVTKLAREITEKEIIPKRALFDEEKIFPRDILKKLAQAGFFGLYVPEEFGGLGGSFLEYILAMEEFSKGCIGISVSFAANALGIHPIQTHGTAYQKEKYLPPLVNGEKLAAFALTEANAGSDASNIQTIAVRDGDDYILNGTKQWITNGEEADIYTIVAMTDRSKGSRGASLFIVEKGTEGFSFGPKENKLGIRASSTTELILQNVRIPKENLIGREGMGFIIAMRNLDQSRPVIAAQGVGLAQAALDEAVYFTRQRIQFGKPIATQPVIQHMIADMATKVEAARALLYAASRYIGSGAKDISKMSAMTKLFSGEIAMEVASDALQLQGGAGYMKDYPVEKMFRDAKILQIYEGTNQIQRNVVGQEVIKENVRLKGR